MSALTCDICGGNLAMNESGEFAICESCGMKHTKERVKVKVQEVKGVVEITKGEAEKERLLKNAEVFLELGEFDKAKKAFEDVTSQFPNEWQGWWGIFRLPFELFLKTGNFFMPDDVNLKNAYKLFTAFSKNESEPFSTFFKKVIKKHGPNLLKEEKTSFVSYDSYSKYRYIDVRVIDVKSGTYKQSGERLSLITLWFIADSYGVFNIINFKLAHDFSKTLQKLYIAAVNSGELTPVLCKETYMPIILNYSRISESTSRSYVCDLLKKYGYKLEGSIWRKNKISVDVNEAFTFDIRWVYGNWISITEGYYDLDCYYYYFENKETISKGLCQHCGGEFKGVFKKVCSKCGKSKDY